jgi:hypothetical protein
LGVCLPVYGVKFLRKGLPEFYQFSFIFAAEGSLDWSHGGFFIIANQSSLIDQCDYLIIA